MNKPLYLAPLAGLPVAALVAWRLGGAVGAGALLGATLALALATGGSAWGQWAALHRPKQFMQVFVVAFLAKLFVLTTGALLLRFADEFGAHVDWTAYLLGFASAVLFATALAPVVQLAVGRTSKESHAS